MDKVGGNIMVVITVKGDLTGGGRTLFMNQVTSEDIWVLCIFIKGCQSRGSWIQIFRVSFVKHHIEFSFHFTIMQVFVMVGHRRSQKQDFSHSYLHIRMPAVISDFVGNAMLKCLLACITNWCNVFVFWLSFEKCSFYELLLQAYIIYIYIFSDIKIRCWNVKTEVSSNVFKTLGLLVCWN